MSVRVRPSAFILTLVFTAEFTISVTQHLCLVILRFEKLRLKLRFELFYVIQLHSNAQ